MAGLADVLFGWANQPPADTAAEWKAWGKGAPWTGALEQQAELQRIRDAQMQALETTEAGKQQMPQGMSGYGEQNQAVMQQVPAVQGDVATMAPLTAEGPVVAPQGAGTDAPGALMRALGDIQVRGGLPGPGMSAAPPQGMPGVMPVPSQGGFADMLKAGMPGPQAPQTGMAPPPQQPQAPAPQGPQQQSIITEPPPQAKWKGMLENLRRPEVMGPLQTFFAAISAPLAPWETPGSRIGRANMMMQMHREMLQQNVTERPQKEEMDRLALEEKRAVVEGRQAGVRKGNVEADIAEATKDAEISKAMEELTTARLNNDLRGEQIAKGKLENRLLRLYGDEQQASEIFARLQNTEYQKGMLGVARQNANTAAERARIADDALGLKGAKELTNMGLPEVAETVNALTQSFRDSGAAAAEGADFITWVSEQYGPKYAQQLNAAMARLKASGGDVTWKSRGTTPMGGANDPLGLRK